MTFIIIVLVSILISMKTDSRKGWFSFWLMLVIWLAGLLIYDVFFDAEAIAYRKEEAKAKAARKIAEETPHVIREADGCKVYAFKSGDRYHYFTRCPDSKTTTESSWDECHSVMNGKTSTQKCVTKSESIEVTK